MATDREALKSLVDVLRERHHGRMPHEVQVAYDEACAALAAPPVEQQAGGFPVIADRGEVLGGGMPDWPAWCSTFRERKAYQQGVADARAMAQATEQPAPQAGAAEHLWSLVEAYSSARIVAYDPASTVAALSHAHARMLRMEVTLRQAFATHPTEQPSQDADQKGDR